MSEEAIVFEGPTQVRLYTLVSLASALAMEINMPGFQVSSRGNALKAARMQHILPEDGKVNGKRADRKVALQLTIDAIKELRPDYEPTRLVARALS